MRFWEYLYIFGSYIAAIICVIAAIKIGLKRGWLQGVIEILILIAFTVAYWLLESHAVRVAPFYSYPPQFGMVPLFDWVNYGLAQCTPLSGAVCGWESACEIALTVLLLEASMTYCLMWTARLLIEQPIGWTGAIYATAVAPFMVGLMALVLDGFLDPVISESYFCNPMPPAVDHIGMVYWQWFAGAHLATAWYGIPMFNYAAWYAAPVILVTAVLLLNWLWELLKYLKGLFVGPPYPAPSTINGLFRLVILLAFLAISITSPDAEKPPVQQIMIIVVAIITSLIVIASRARHYHRTNPFRWEFVVPQVFFFLLPLFMLLFSGRFNLPTEWHLVLVSLLCAVVGIFFAFSPYSGNWWPHSRARVPLKPTAQPLTGAHLPGDMERSGH